MLTTIANSFVDYVNVVETLPLVASFPIFRGQAISGSLLPGVARSNPLADTMKSEQEMLNQLLLQGTTLLPHAPTKLDLLVIAQHFGMKTRLLDWTSNPIAALWFACSSHRTGDAFVYVLDTADLLLQDPYGQDPFSHGRTKVFQPRLNNSRIVAQSGWFSLHCFSPRSHRWVALEKHAKLQPRLTEIRVPESSRTQMLQAIDRHGMGSRSLFPDLEGLCKHLNWRHLGV
jgi:hypothetical protein